jgi:hypothetical protein
MTTYLTILLDGEDQFTHESQELQPKALPHERYLIGESFPLAAALNPHVNNPQHALLCIEPIHLHATRDHLVLLPLHEISIPAGDVETLMKEASAVFHEAGLGPLLQIDLNRWICDAQMFSSLYTHSLAQASGRNIDWWLPKDTTELGLAKRWRKIQNEIQMRWHIHPINESREAQGLPRMNSVWIDGIGKEADISLAAELCMAKQIISDQSWMSGIANRLKIPLLNPASMQWELLDSQAFIWHQNLQKMWPSLARMLSEHDLEMTLIDFPKSIRKRILKSQDYQTRSWKLWHKKNPPTWAELSQ